MTVDALIARLTQDAQARVAALRAAADAEIAALDAAGASASAREREQTLEARRAARRGALDAERARAQRQARGARADRAARLSRSRLRAGRGARRRRPTRIRATSRRCRAHVAAVVRFLGGAPATLRCRPELVPRVRPCLAAAPGIELVADAMLPAGLAAATRDGRCTIDCTLPARLSALRPRLEAGLLARVPR